MRLCVERVICRYLHITDALRVKMRMNAVVYVEVHNRIHKHVGIV